MNQAACVGILAKLFRAEEHFDRLEREVVAYLRDNEPLVGGEFHVTRDNGLVGVKPTSVQLKIVPPEIGTTIGDVTHCLRSVLDHLAWNLVEDPTENTYFPIEDLPNGYNRFRRPNPPTIASRPRPGVRAAVAQFQPWYRSGVTDRLHPLRVLRELSNHDKHRQLTTILHNYGASFSELEFARLPVDMMLVPRFHSVNITEGSAKYRLVPPANAHMDVDVYFDYAVWGRIVAAKTGDSIDFPILPKLREIGRLIKEQVVPTLAPLARHDDEL